MITAIGALQSSQSVEKNLCLQFILVCKCFQLIAHVLLTKNTIP